MILVQDMFCQRMVDVLFACISKRVSWLKILARQIKGFESFMVHGKHMFSFS